MDFSGGGGGGRGEADRWLEIAGKLLAARDLVGCKRFAERAVESDPLLAGADELLAVADVLLASQRRLPSGSPDHYAVLQVSAADSDAAAVKRSYRRLALLLDASRNPHPGADAALRLVSDAFAVLSDPSKKSPFDAEYDRAKPSPSPPPPQAQAQAQAPAQAQAQSQATPPSGGSLGAAAGTGSAVASSFWTACPFCCYVHQYAKGLSGRALMCPNAGCRRAFLAAEIPSAPPVVPGTEMYYCAWGFFPLGFPSAADLGSSWKPFYPMFPWNSPSQPDSGGSGGKSGANNSTKPPGNMQPPNGGGSGSGGVGGAPRGRIKKTTARKKVGAGLKRRAFGGVESGIEPELLGPDAWGGSEDSGREGNVQEAGGININEAVKVTESGGVQIGGDEDMVGFHLDVDATDDILGNLQHLPFLREEGNLGRML